MQSNTETALERIRSDLALFDDWEDRYRYIIELGRGLGTFPEELRTEANKVRGCASQVWLVTNMQKPDPSGQPVFDLLGDSDAHIVRGLVALVLALYSGRPAQEIVDTDAAPLFRELGFAEHLTPQRANGLRSMVERIKKEARGALAA